MQLKLYLLNLLKLIKHKMRIIQPSIILILILLFLQLLPGLYILYFEHYEYLYGSINGSYEENARLYVLSCFIFVFFIFVGRFIVPLDSFKLKIVNNIDLGLINFEVLRYAKLIGFISIAIVVYYVLDGGYKKFLAIGTDIDPWEFRLIGYEDRPRYLIALLEIARRFLLPLSLLYLLVFKVFYRIKIKLLTFILVVTQLVAAFMTLDRAPFFTLFVVIIFPYFFLDLGFYRILKIFILILSSMILIGGVITNLQYNILDFKFYDVVGMGLDFIIHRFFLVPSIAPIELSYSLFPIDYPKLLLEHSRLLGLLGFDVVGTSDYESIYVSPVGAIGDIWRNFGIYGVCLVGFVLGLIFKIIDIDDSIIPLPVVVVQYFLVFALSFYYVMGVFFSQGAFFALIICMTHIQFMKIFLKIRV